MSQVEIVRFSQMVQTSIETFYYVCSTLFAPRSGGHKHCSEYYYFVLCHYHPIIPCVWLSTQLNRVLDFGFAINENMKTNKTLFVKVSNAQIYPG